MNVTGIYRLALRPGADEQAFLAHMKTEVFTSATILQSTRITRDFQHRLVKVEGPVPQFLWIVRVDLVTDKGYDFADNIDRVRESLQAFGVLAGLETGVDVAEG